MRKIEQEIEKKYNDKEEKQKHKKKRLTKKCINADNSFFSFYWYAKK